MKKMLQWVSTPDNGMDKVFIFEHFPSWCLILLSYGRFKAYSSKCEHLSGSPSQGFLFPAGCRAGMPRLTPESLVPVSHGPVVTLCFLQLVLEYSALWGFGLAPWELKHAWNFWCLRILFTYYFFSGRLSNATECHIHSRGLPPDLLGTMHLSGCRAVTSRLWTPLSFGWLF